MISAQKKVVTVVDKLAKSFVDKRPAAPACLASGFKNLHRPALMRKVNRSRQSGYARADDVDGSHWSKPWLNDDWRRKGPARRDSQLFKARELERFGDFIPPSGLQALKIFLIHAHHQESRANRSPV